MAAVLMSDVFIRLYFFGNTHTVGTLRIVGSVPISLEYPNRYNIFLKYYFTCFYDKTTIV